MARKQDIFERCPASAELDRDRDVLIISERVQRQPLGGSLRAVQRCEPRCRALEQCNSLFLATNTTVGETEFFHGEAVRVDDEDRRGDAGQAGDPC